MRALSPSATLQLVVLFSLAPGAIGPVVGAETPFTAPTITPSNAPAVTPAEIEADWLAQIRLRYQPHPNLGPKHAPAVQHQTGARRGRRM